MAGIDVHQHLWPPGFLAALSGRSVAPFLRDGILHLREGSYPAGEQDHELSTRLAVLDRAGIDVAVVSLQPTLGLDGIPPDEQETLVRAWEEGILELAAAAAGRIVPLAAGRPREGFAGASIGAGRLDDLDELSPLLDSMRGGGILFVHPDAGEPPPGAPAWWPAVVEYTSQMQKAYFAWLASGQERWPDVTIVFAILAGGGPVQLERLASRGADVRSSLHANVYFDTASYGRRALELCIQTFGVEQLVFGTDTPVVEPEHAAAALEGFGESVERLVRLDNLSRLLA